MAGICFLYVSNMMTSFGVIRLLTNGNPEGRLLWRAELLWRISVLLEPKLISLSNDLLLINTFVPLQHLNGAFLWSSWFCLKDNLSLLWVRDRPGTHVAEVPSTHVFSVLDWVPARVCATVLLRRHLQNQSEICLTHGKRLSKETWNSLNFLFNGYEKYRIKRKVSLEKRILEAV